jgi:hypothetical protein
LIWDVKPFYREKQMSIHKPPCVMTSSDDFYVCVCGCGLVHLSFGPAVVNATPETVIALSETLREVSAALRAKLSSGGAAAEPAAPPPAQPHNVVRGRFPAPTSRG